MGRKSQFDAEYRAHAVEMMRLSAKPRSRIADDLGVSTTTLGKWMTAANRQRKQDPLPVDLTESEREELVRLRSDMERIRAENRELLVDREILKKGVAFWVKENRG